MRFIFKTDYVQDINLVKHRVATRDLCSRRLVPMLVCDEQLCADMRE